MRNSGIDKGVAAMHWLSKMKKDNRFILVAGDDLTDEDLFRVMPEGAFSIKVGQQSSYALLNVARQEDLVNLLNDLKA
jgi:trehalose 6-phosphate synthase/phosphatase